MRKRFWFGPVAAGLAVLTIHASPPADDLIARIHFAGAATVAANTNAVAFTNLWCTPEARVLRDQTLDKLARAPAAWFRQKIPAGAGDGAAQLRPLLDDFLSAEWFLQVRDATNGSPEYALAIHLAPGRAALWETNLENVLQAWTGMAVEKRADGWRLKKHRPPDAIQFTRTGDWVVFGLGQDSLPLTDEWVRQAAAAKRPAPADNEAWFAADLDWPRLAQWFPSANPLDLPETQWRVAARELNLRWDGKLLFSSPRDLNLETWRIPTNQIHMPLISFTAIRGFAPWLEKQDWIQPYQLYPVPNQILTWAMLGLPLQTFVALPRPDALQSIAALKYKLSANPGWRNNFVLPLTMNATNNRISFTGLPFVAPDIEARHEPASDFLFGEVFPNTPGSRKPLPPELYAQLSQTNLVYFDWEVTGERLKRLPQLTQLALMVTGHKQLDARSAAGKWLASLILQNQTAVTEVLQTSPTELTFKRKAPAGFTAIELTALANWLEATNFPGCDLHGLPRRNPRRPNPAVPGAPPSVQVIQMP